MPLTLRPTIPADLRIFFDQQSDKTAIQMAAFTSENPHDKKAYLDKWTRLLADDTINSQTILLDDLVIGSVSKFERAGEAEITYALDKAHWNKGWTTKALRLFLAIETTRPIHGRVAYDNYGSQRVLEKVGFQLIEKAIFFANARGKEIEEFVYRLD